MRNTIILLTSLVGFCAVVSGYPSTAGEPACENNLTPSHAGASPQTDDSPYSIDLEPKDGWTAGNPITIKIAGINKLKGFLLVAKDANGELLSGSYNHINADTQDGPCKDAGGAVASATHTSRSDKDSVTFEWTPPDSHDGEVRFEAAVVKSMEVFWIGLTQALPKATGEASTGAPATTTSGDMDTDSDTITSKPTDASDSDKDNDKDNDMDNESDQNEIKGDETTKNPNSSSQLAVSTALFITVALAKYLTF